MVPLRLRPRVVEGVAVITDTIVLLVAVLAAYLLIDAVCSCAE